MRIRAQKQAFPTIDTFEFCPDDILKDVLSKRKNQKDIGNALACEAVKVFLNSSEFEARLSSDEKEKLKIVIFQGDEPFFEFNFSKLFSKKRDALFFESETESLIKELEKIIRKLKTDKMGLS